MNQLFKCSDCDKNAKYEFIDNDEGFKKNTCVMMYKKFISKVKIMILRK